MHAQDHGHWVIFATCVSITDEVSRFTVLQAEVTVCSQDKKSGRWAWSWREEVDEGRAALGDHIKNSNYLPLCGRPSASHCKFIIAFNAPNNSHFKEACGSQRIWVSASVTWVVSGWWKQAAGPEGTILRPKLSSPAQTYLLRQGHALTPWTWILLSR